MASLSLWCQSHQVAFSLILTTTVFAASLYATEIRSFLEHWPRTKRALTKEGVSRIEGRIRLLNTLKDKPYELILWITFQMTDACMWGFLLIVMEGLVFSMAKIYVQKSPTGLLAGLLLGRAIAVREVVQDLMHFDSAMARLLNHRGTLQTSLGGLPTQSTQTLNQ